MDVKESYRILELEIGASRAAVDAAFCRLIERWHPDRAAPGDPEAVREAQRMVQAINDAYQTLVKIAPNSAEPPAPQQTATPPALSKVEGPIAAAKPPAKPTLRPLPAGQPTPGRLPPPPPPPPPETWAARSASVSSAPPPPNPASPPAPLPGDLSHRAGGATDLGLAAASNRVPGQTPAGPQAGTVTPAASSPEPPAAQSAASSAPGGKVAAFYEKLFPAGSPQRRFGAVIPVAALALAVLLGKCAFPASGSKSTQTSAAASAPDPKTTGGLVVKSNLANTTVEAARIPTAGEAAPAAITGPDGGAAEQTLAGLPTGKYAVTARAGGWPEIHQEVIVEPGRTTEVAINFKSGSLRLDSDPAGATVRQGAAVLGVTPLVIPQLPPGECQFSLKYQSWPVAAFKTTITESVESTGTVRLPHGKLTVETTPPGATVLLGDYAAGQTPLTLERVPAGIRKLTLRAKDFPPVEVTVTVEDRGDVKIHPALGSGFPVLDPAALLRAIWIPDNDDRIVPPIEGVTGPFQSQNGIVKNLNRKWLFENWLRKRYCFTGIVKSYDRASGQIEFAEQQSDLSKYRVLAKLSVEARNDQALATQLVKGATFAVYGRLSAVEEPRWPFKVITFEFSAAEPLR